MPTVPMAQRQVEIGATPIAKQSPDASLETFGGGASQNALAASAAKLGATGEDIYKEEKQKADQSALTGLDLEATKEQTRIEMAVKNLRGKDAASAVDFANSEWTAVSDRLKDKAANREQQDGIGKLLSARAGQIDRTVQFHTADELHKADEQQSESYIAAQADHAVLHHDVPDLIKQDLDNQKAEIERVGQRQGWDAGTIELKQRDSNSLTLSAIVSRKLDTQDYKGAQAFFDANKEGFAAHDVGRVEKSLEDGRTLELGKAAYSKYGKMKLSDGEPDMARMEAAINADPDLKDKERERVLTFVKQKAGEDKMNMLAQDRARNESFYNAAVTAKKNGQTLEQSMALARAAAKGSYDQAVKEDWLGKLFAPPAASNDSVKFAVWKSIQDGTATQASIDAAMRSDGLNAQDHFTLSKENYTAQIEGKSPEMKRVNDDIANLATKKYGTAFGGESGDTKLFINVVNDKSAGKSPSEKWQIAQDLMKDVPDKSTEWMFGLFGGTAPGYKVDQRKFSDDSLIVGSITKDVGADAMAAIKGGATKSGKTFSPVYLDQFKEAFGGIDNIKPGTPAGNAIKSLSSLNKAVTVESVRAALANVPDGNFGEYGVPAAAHKAAHFPRRGK